MRAEQNSIIPPAEAAALFRDLEGLPALVLAVSGGPDSTALMWLAARWRAGLEDGPKLVAVTVDHGLRREAAAEARAVGRLARTLGVAHRTLRWTGKKPATGLQEAARIARYRLLADAARTVGARAIVTAHTQDDQAETVLFRMARGSGLTGLAGMRRISPLPVAQQAPRLGGRDGDAAARLEAVRPFLSVQKSRLIATLRAAGIPFSEDPSNRDPRFTRPRLRKLLPALAEEGLDTARFSHLAARLGRAEAALALDAERAYAALVKRAENGELVLPAPGFVALSEEIGLRLLSRAVDETGDEGPVELGKAEQLYAALLAASRSSAARFRRSLAGALVTLTRDYVTVERAPARRTRKP